MTRKLPRTLAAGAAVIALALGAWAIGNSTSSDTTSSASSAPAAARSGQAPPSSSAQTPPAQGGQSPRPGFGTPVQGATAAKVEKAALARYPGTLEGVMALPDGSYVAHVITANGELHVAVSKDFKVLGVRQGGPPGAGPQGGTPPAGAGAPPAGAQPQGQGTQA